MAMIEKTLDSPQLYKLNLIPYAAEVSQEFSWGNLGQVGKADIADSPVPDIVDCPVQWNNCSLPDTHRSDSVETGDTIRTPVLRELIKLRQDDPSYGFVVNTHGQVFKADSKTLKTLESLGDRPVRELAKQHPEVFESLGIAI